MSGSVSPRLRPGGGRLSTGGGREETGPGFRVRSGVGLGLRRRGGRRGGDGGRGDWGWSGFGNGLGRRGRGASPRLGRRLRCFGRVWEPARCRPYEPAAGPPRQAGRRAPSRRQGLGHGRTGGAVAAALRPGCAPTPTATHAQATAAALPAEPRTRPRPGPPVGGRGQERLLPEPPTLGHLEPAQDAVPVPRRRRRGAAPARGRQAPAELVALILVEGERGAHLDQRPGAPGPSPVRGPVAAGRVPVGRREASRRSRWPVRQGARTPR